MPCAKEKGVSWIDKLRFIRNYAVNGCETNLLIYVNTGAWATTNLVMNLVGISPTEAVYTMLRPKGARTDRHGGGRTPRNVAKGKTTGPGGKYFSNEEAIPDSAELVQNTIETITEWEKPVYSTAGEAIFEIAKPIIATAYYITLVSAATDFAYDWYSGILLNPGSHCEGNRFSWLGEWTDPPNQGFENWMPARALFAPEGAYLDPDGIHIEKGTWIIQIEFQAVATPHATWDATEVMRLMLGVFDKVQCGPSLVNNLPAGTTDATVKWVHKVIGPDVLVPQLAVVSEHSPFSTHGGFYKISGFAI